MDKTAHSLFAAATTCTNRRQCGPRSKRTGKVKVQVKVTSQNKSIHLISQRAGE